MDYQTILAALARHALSTAAGALAAHGYISSSDTEKYVGAGMLILAGLWSWWQKKGQAEAIATLNTIIDYRRGPAAQKQPAAPSVTK